MNNIDGIISNCDRFVLVCLCFFWVIDGWTWVGVYHRSPPLDIHWGGRDVTFLATPLFIIVNTPSLCYWLTADRQWTLPYIADVICRRYLPIHIWSFFNGRLASFVTTSCMSGPGLLLVWRAVVRLSVGQSNRDDRSSGGFWVNMWNMRCLWLSLFFSPTDLEATPPNRFLTQNGLNDVVPRIDVPFAVKIKTFSNPWPSGPENRQNLALLGWHSVTS